MEQEKYREKEKSGRPAKLKEKKGDRDLEREIKSKGDIFLLEEQHENFVAVVTMLAATNARIKWVNTYEISSIKKFLEVSRCSRPKQRQRNVQKSVLHVQSCFFAN